MVKPIELSQKRGWENGGDRISNIPDDLLSDVLSRLPIKDAMRTSVLSKAWEFKWTSIYHVKLDARDSIPPESKHKNNLIFFEFVEKMLLRLQRIQSFHFACSCSRKNELRRLMRNLVSSVIGRNVESLELRVYDFETHFLPRSLLNCASLKNLVLQMRCTFEIAVTNCFPNLERLYLEGVKFLNTYSKDGMVVFNFPVLEALELVECEWWELQVVEINAPLLTTFEFKYEKDVDEECSFLMKIIGARLQKFIMVVDYPQKIVFADSTVDFADLSCFVSEGTNDFEKCGLQNRKLLGELSHLKSLALTNFLPAIAHTKPAGIGLPRFVKLEKLCVDVEISATGLLELLHATPFLKSLHLLMGDPDEDEDEVYFDYDAVVESVPSCLVSHLETLELDYSLVFSILDLNMAKFLLKNGLQLKNVYADTSIIEDLLAFPKGSTCLIIESNGKQGRSEE